MKAVIFDLDGVITDTAEYHFQAWASLAAALSIPFDREFNEQLKGISRTESLDKILARGNLSDTFSEEGKQELATRKNTEYQRLISAVTPSDILPGIKALLTELREARIGIALASASKNAAFILERLELAYYFDSVVDVTAIRHGKPDPEIFLTGAANLGVQPADCIGIEDAQAGIQAIKGAGMFAVGVGTPSQMQGADIVVATTAELSLSMLEAHFYEFKK
ncbi:beta-phosphoglucomutase [Paenibacillus sp. SEL3]|uniref:Beta-phosphoglucomutase n=1 Tax=Paenibacillus polymyxa TaxID=1406 RepID=A0A8I1LRV1_PAEPO|nr:MULTISPECIES: beta-phosphoglucomutase [Paenibacillus]KAF6571827.1 beta-phosphoglucomutase [Paenibacillus sp. EKM206P]KAF6586540.1 beta-phosphoglucomutase [Paenibacillus sp. EKM205P]MBM0635184.1 beta-phosphoglucomutase [Paenibacillus polymyxa]